MTDVSSLLVLDQFSCSICLELLKDPVSILCGHSFCMVCISKCWDQEDEDGMFSCPQCRQTFTPRPVVNRNTILADVVEKLKETQPQIPSPPGPEDVECDFCTESKNKAVKSCLVCLVSFCETHLQPHYQVPAFKKHKLVEASRRLQDQICSQHDKLLEVYCRTDHKCICMLCIMDDHKGHVVETVASERNQKQIHLQESHQKWQQSLQNKKKELQELTDVVEAHKNSAQTAVKNMERTCGELIRSIERRCSEVTELIRVQVKAAVSRAEDVMEEVRREIVALQKKNAEVEELLKTKDHIHFLQNNDSLSTQPQSTDLPSHPFNPLVVFEDVESYVSQIKDKVLELCHEDFQTTINTVKEIQIIPLPEPRNREEFQHYTTCLTLDPNTSNPYLRLSEENKVVTCSGTSHSYPDHPDRFDYFLQVLCSESVCGRCYWELEWTGKLGIYIAVSYKSISRKGRSNQCMFGQNHQSWRLLCSTNGCSYRHLKKETKLPIMPSSCRIGVYVDYRAGILSFYNVSDTMKLLHTVQTKFTRTLYPGFMVPLGSKVKL